MLWMQWRRDWLSDPLLLIQALAHWLKITYKMDGLDKLFFLIDETFIEEGKTSWWYNRAVEPT